MTKPLNAIANARLQGRDGLFRLEISNGRFSGITAQAENTTVNEGELDAGENLVTAPFVEPHICLLYTSDAADE